MLHRLRSDEYLGYIRASYLTLMFMYVHRMCPVILGDLRFEKALLLLHWSKRSQSFSAKHKERRTVDLKDSASRGKMFLQSSKVLKVNDHDLILFVCKRNSVIFTSSTSADVGNRTTYLGVNLLN